MLGQAMHKTLHFTKAADRFKKRENREEDRKSVGKLREEIVVFCESAHRDSSYFCISFQLCC